MHKASLFVANCAQKPKFQALWKTLARNGELSTTFHKIQFLDQCLVCFNEAVQISGKGETRTDHSLDFVSGSP